MKRFDRRSRPILTAAGMVMADHSLGCLTDRPLNLRYLLRMLEELPPGTYEVCMNPNEDSHAAELEALLDWAACSQTTLALLKLGHRWDWVRPLLASRGLLDQALFAQRVGWPEQLLAPAVAVPAAEQPYFSLLLIRQGWPAVLP